MNVSPLAPPPTSFAPHQPSNRARARVDNQQHLVISNGHVGIISRGLALRRLQQHFRVRYTKTRTDAANVLSTWYRERYYARLFRRIDAANKVRRSSVPQPHADHVGDRLSPVRRVTLLRYYY
jgi:hypothetical protein